MKTILYCNCSRAGLISDSVRSVVLDTLDKAGVAYLYTDDLCGLCADLDSPLAKTVADDSLIVLACFPRAVNALLNRAGLGDVLDVRSINLKTADPEILAEQLEISDVRPGKRITLNHSNPAWEPWYPVIDYDRCKQCRQCLNFCLFGVFTQDDDHCVHVAQPTHCKTGCPACARVCPAAAIIFPKYGKIPINGDTVNEEDWKNTPPPPDLQQRLRGNVMNILRKRTASTASDSLEQMKRELDIPDSVIENLKKEKHG